MFCSVSFHFIFLFNLFYEIWSFLHWVFHKRFPLDNCCLLSTTKLKTSLPQSAARPSTPPTTIIRICRQHYVGPNVNNINVINIRLKLTNYQPMCQRDRYNFRQKRQPHVISKSIGIHNINIIIDGIDIDIMSVIIIVSNI